MYTTMHQRGAWDQAWKPRQPQPEVQNIFGPIISVLTNIIKLADLASEALLCKKKNQQQTVLQWWLNWKHLPFKSGTLLSKLTRYVQVWGYLKCLLFIFHFLKKIWGHKSLSFGHWHPCFGLLVISALHFKARVDPLLVCFLTCVQQIPQIHLWCNTYWLYTGQHVSQDFSIHILTDVSTSISGGSGQGSNPWPSRPGHMQQA